jgi:arsenite-transporting ATPase
LIIFAGKGGVGKTTLASATAVTLARKNPQTKVLLFSTDPAHSLSDCLGGRFGPAPHELFANLSVVEMDAQNEFLELKSQYKAELKQFFARILPNMDLMFDRDVMERILDLSPPGLDEIMAMTSVMDLLESRKYDLLVLDTAPTGHFLRLLEMPEIIDSWLKVIFGLFLKYRNVFKMPKVNQRLIGMSKSLKSMRKLIHNPEQSPVYVVTIPTEMAFQETLDLVAACKKMETGVAGIFINMAAQAGGCCTCDGLAGMEKAMFHRYGDEFGSIPQSVIFRDGDLRGPDRLEALGLAMFDWPQPGAAP